MKNLKSFIYTMLLFITILTSSATAQNKISLLRYDDDFSYLKNDSLKKGVEHLKFINLRNKNYISFGGELREQFQSYKNLNFGDVPPNYNHISVNQLWHRLMLHTDIELSNHIRFFIQINNTLRFLNTNPVVPEIDENQLSLHQAFAELKANNWKFRLGRQELFYGNHRLLTVREGPNTRQTFDGLIIKRKLKNGAIDFFAVSKTISKQYVFDDQSFKEYLVGLYGTQYLSNRKISLDYYAVNFHSKLKKYNYQTGTENRETYGIRLISDFKNINFEVEGSYQSGKFKDLIISAYSILTDVNLTVLANKKGIIGFTANVVSGDKNNSDKKLNTYNLLYAKPAYGLAAPIGATNIISLNPYIKYAFQKLNIIAQVFFLSRNSNMDGTYSPGMIQNRPDPDLLFVSKKKDLGEFYVIETNYQQTKNLSFSFDVSFIKAGSYTISTGSGKDISYVSFKSTLKF